jgi:hypothetical protein
MNTYEVCIYNGIGSNTMLRIPIAYETPAEAHDGLNLWFETLIKQYNPIYAKKYPNDMGFLMELSDDTCPELPSPWIEGYIYRGNAWSAPA